ncbi:MULTISPECIES: hypothetical protein [Vibrio]|uniref:hypothetical protein n=1 Tax=Vibrio TaxID=662 RepID=UPI000C819082|nr:MULTISPECIES: hypothetical protein [Vibrio]PMJ81298.1 hypothetical protein BCU14_18595 [Vibrio lentus]PMN40622.1 hypothetical protein BCT33_18670 [Vibrio lentus]PMN60457.1 hypothetical protein BCT29_21190 [Vibrio lentus]ROR79894.1 hypothetical protein EDB66_2985 [Vibrio crassostreae]TQL39899.1 hypothetical protein FB443_10386 [Vibrio crassostreae]
MIEINIDDTVLNIKDHNEYKVIDIKGDLANCKLSSYGISASVCWINKKDLRFIPPVDVAVGAAIDNDDYDWTPPL